MPGSWGSWDHKTLGIGSGNQSQVCKSKLNNRAIYPALLCLKLPTEKNIRILKLKFSDMKSEIRVCPHFLTLKLNL